MPKKCPPSVELLLAALELDPASASSKLTEHLITCPDCRREVDDLRAAAFALKTAPPAEQPPVGACLDELDLAALLDDRATGDVGSLAHLVACTSCQAQLVGSIRLLQDQSMIKELERLDPIAEPKRRRPLLIRLSLVSGLAAAALLAVWLWPDPTMSSGLRGAGDTGGYRERTITMAAAPRILGPFGAAASADSLRWTAVPRADLYRVTVWDRDGAVAWRGQTRDTVLPLPSELRGDGKPSLLWEVKARTGWERWVSSELAELTIKETGRIRP